ERPLDGRAWQAPGAVEQLLELVWAARVELGWHVWRSPDLSVVLEYVGSRCRLAGPTGGRIETNTAFLEVGQDLAEGVPHCPIQLEVVALPGREASQLLVEERLDGQWCRGIERCVVDELSEQVRVVGYDLGQRDELALLLG